MHFPRRGAGPGGQGRVSPQRSPGAGPPHRARPARSPRGPRSPARLPAPGGRYSGAEGPIPARPRTELRKARLGRAGRAIPHGSYGNTRPRARPSVPPSLPPSAPTGSSARPAAPPGQAGAYTPHGLCPRQTPAAGMGDLETAARERGVRVWSLGQKYSQHPEAALSLSDKGFECQQHPKTGGGERHSSDDPNTAPGVGSITGTSTWKEQE